MAKMFYTMDETKAALGKSEEDIKQLAREGKLREFRDGPRLMFKADQVEALKGELAAGAADQVGLGAGDTHTPLGLMDSKTGSGSGVATKGGDTATLKEDTATGAAPPTKEGGGSGNMDVGLSGSLSGSIGGGSLAGSLGGGSLAGSMGGTGVGSGVGSGGQNRGTGKPGVNVFGDEGAEVDPMAQTHITPPKDAISLEGVGSGSGLLDLTRETDDTSLGAALLDEISPGGKRVSPTPGAAPPLSSGSTAGMTSISPMEIPPESVATEAPVVGGYAPMVVEAPDSVAPAFGLASLATAIVVLVASFVLINAIVNDTPLVDSRVDIFKKENAHFIFLGIGFALAVVGFISGIIAGKSRMQTV